MDRGEGDLTFGPRGSETGFGIVGLIATLAILGMLAVLAAVAIPSGPGAVTTSSHDPGLGTSAAGAAAAAAPGGRIPQAADSVAQTNLKSALSVVDEAAVTAGGYGRVGVASLVALDNRIPFTAGASTNASQIGVAAAGGVNGGVTLVVRSDSGTCWFAWRSNAETWFGAETGRPSCAAPALGNAPAAGAEGNGVIGWQVSAFPGA